MEVTWQSVALSRSTWCHRPWVDGRVLARGDLPDALGNVAFAGALTRLLASSSMPGFAWECAPLGRGLGGLPFEFVVVESPALGKLVADPTPFREHLDACAAPVCTFDNLGGTATLVVPHPAHVRDAAHLARFVRAADEDVAAALWSAVGAAVRQRLAVRDTVWLSTAGLGVSWLHVRLDDRPKYYRHAPYTAIERRRA